MAGASLGAPPGTVVSSIGPLTSLAPSGIQLQGEIGRRFGASIENRLLRIEVDQLLACFERRDCTGSWDGEYVGKWLDAASLAYSVTRNQRLLERMDVVTRRLIATQDTDGYLGTYPRGRRFVFEDVYTSDVWVHRYVLIGLLSYYEATRDAAVWAALTRAADLLVETFGDRPEQRSILAVGYHQGLAATAVLEPMARLYAFSREPRYLEFCRAIVRAWDSPGGPRLLSHLLSRQPIQDLAGGKAYEILANVVGLVELYDITGDRELLTAAVNAWEEVSREQLYVTGGSSRFERFQAQGPRPYTAADDVQENCVTVTWLRLNHRLLQVTGEARFAESYMWTACNQLLASQARDASQWCYYCPLAGRKPYTPYLTCCSSNGPRGIAWFADNSVMTAPSGPAVLLYAPGSYGFVTPGGRNGTLRISGDFPFGDRVTIKVEIEAPEQFSLNLLTPSWARGATVEIPGRTPRRFPNGPAFLAVRRKWTDGDLLAVDFRFRARRIPLEQPHPGLGALALGPLVLAYDAAANPSHQGIEFQDLLLSRVRVGALRLSATGNRGGSGPVYEVPVRGSGTASSVFLLRPWALAGDGGSYVRVLLPTRSPSADEAPWSLFAYWSNASQSVLGNVSGSFNDDLTTSYSVTFNGGPQPDAWFALEAPQPLTFTRVTYCHGQVFHDGGWFDAAAGGPRFEIKRTRDGTWEDLAPVDGYPATTATNPSSLVAGQCFSTVVPQTVAIALRVRGRPATGDLPAQSFTSCAELQAWP